MARQRTIKPEFWTDATIGECSVSARLVFVASWNFADDYGGLDRSAKQLKAQAFPYDVIDCEPLIVELIGLGLFIEYEVGGKKYLHIKNFLKHQKVENPSRPRIPPYEATDNNHLPLSEDSDSPQSRYQRTITKDQISKIKNQESEKKAEASPVPTQQAPRETHSGLEWFVDFKLAYPSRAGDQNWHGAQKAARARMREGHSPAEMLDGARRYSAYIRAIGKFHTEFVKQASTFLGPGKPFLNEWQLPSSAGQIREDQNIDAATEWLRSSNGSN